MKQHQSGSVDYSVDAHDQQEEDDMNDYDDDDDLWLSGHRSIFSSYESPCPKVQSSLHGSLYESFHWDFYENPNYHQITFDNNQQNLYEEKRLSQWSMNLNSDDKTSISCNQRRTSWNEIKAKSIQHIDSSSEETLDSDHHSLNPLQLYLTFQHTKSQHHPFRLYENFSDRSEHNSLSTTTSSLSSLDLNFVQHRDEVSIENEGLDKKQLKNTMDQCIQTSIHRTELSHGIIPYSNNADCHLSNPTRVSSMSQHSLPNLEFLTFYAKENLPSALTDRHPSKHICRAMKSTLSEPLSLDRKVTCAIFYFTIETSNPSVTPHSSLSSKVHIQTAQRNKRLRNMKCNSSKTYHEETVTLSSTCSSSSSSGYCSNGSTNQPHPTQTPLSIHPLKSCLKRTKVDQSNASFPLVNNHSADNAREDTLKLIDPSIVNENDSSKDRRFSEPNPYANEQNFLFKFRTRDKNYTLSEHDLRVKKNVSFCDEIVRRLITPSTSPKHTHGDDCDLLPQEYLIDSPPNEFNLSDDRNDDVAENQPINHIEDVPSTLPKGCPLKQKNDRFLIDAFADTILHILEVKCSDPKSYYLNNLTNNELDRILRHDLCPLIRELLEDGLRQYSGSLFSKKVNLWRMIDITTPTASRFNEAKTKAQADLLSTVDWTEKFNAFIYHLLNLHELASWLTHFIANRTILKTYYESSAFVIVNSNNMNNNHSDLFERIINQFEKLSPLPFQLKYKILPNSKATLTNQNLSSSSVLMRKFNVRGWLRDRKSQVKISPKESHMSTKRAISSNTLTRRKQSSIPVPKQS